MCIEDVHGEVGVPLSKAGIFFSCASSQWQCGRRLCGWQGVSHQEGWRDGKKTNMQMDHRELMDLSIVCV